MAKILDKDPATYDRERDAFLKDLQHFHETRGTPIKRPPKINGYEIDLYLLYVLVTGRGGWLKVNSKNEWDLIQESFRIPRHCVNSCVALKQIYLRYLDRYEKVHFLGEVGERSNDDDEDSRHRRWSARALHSVPLTYNYTQHNVPDSLRSYNGLSVNMYKPSDYDKLALSLISPLPNEQDFAINVCTLLSNEGKHTLKLDKHPRILHFLLGHAAVFNHTSTKELFMEQYSKVRGHSMSQFWIDVLEDKDLIVLLDESKYVKKKKCRYIGYYDVINDELKKTDGAEPKRTSMSSKSTVRNDDDVIMCDEEAGLRLQPEDKELFCLGRTLGTQDYFGQRVIQIAMILRNLSFTEENVVIMGKDITFLRFIMLCCGSRWNCLHQLGLDMLANVASEVTLSDLILDPLLNIINKGLESQDRAVALSCVEVLNKLGQNESNEELLLRCLDDKVYERICSFLTLQDIMLLVHTLECLYSLSSLGERSCNAIVRVHGSLDTLVSLITVEAQSYGPKACVLMRVVETVSNVGQTSTPTTSMASTTGSTLTPQPVSSTAASTTITSMPLPAPVVARPVITATSVTANVHASSPNVTPTSVVVTHPHPVVSTSTASAVATQRVVVPVTAAHTTQQVAQENEQFALNWLRSNFEPSNGSRIEQGELYKQYITTCAKIGRRGVIAPNHFPRCVRNAFGAAVGPRQTMVGDTAVHHYEGIQVRGTKTTPQPVNSPQQHIINPINTATNPQQRPPTPQQQQHQLTSPQPHSTASLIVSPASNSITSLPSLPVSPILKAQLCAPPKPSPASASSSPSPSNMTSTPTKPIKKEIKSKVSSHPHLSQALRGVGTSNSPTPSPSPPTTVSVTVAASTNTTTTITMTSTTSSSPITSAASNVITDGTNTNAVVSSSSGSGTASSSGSSTSLIKSLLANKVTDPPHYSCATSSASSLVSGITGPTRCLAIERAQQVTQRQRLLQQQQLLQTSVQGSTVVQSVQSTVTSALAQVRSPTSSPVPATVAVTFVNSVPKLVSGKPVISRINGARATIKQIEAAVEAKIHSEMQVQIVAEREREGHSQNSSNVGTNDQQMIVISSTSTGTITSVTVTENHIGGRITPHHQQSQQITVRPNLPVQHVAPVPNVTNITSVTSATTMTPSSNIKHYPNTRLDMEDSDSTGNNSLASSGIRDNCSATGGEEGENSLTSFEGFLNGVPHSLDVDDTTSKDSAPKSLMLADLLEKTVEKNEPPVLNGALRLGERGLELSPPPNKQRPPTPVVAANNNNNSNNNNNNNNNNSNSNKRPNDDPSIEPDPKRLHVNGDATNDEPPEEGSVSSTAANLYAALAADVVGEEDMEEEQPPTPPQPLIVAHAPAPRQILVTAGGQIALQQRVAVMGQHYVVAQPQTALVQGQTQTVLVAQTAQQQGTATKTIIILQPQTAQAPTQPPPPPQPQKVIVQRLQSPPPPPPLMSVPTPSPSQSPTPHLPTKPPPMKVLRAVPSPPTQSAPVIVSTAILTQQHTPTHVVHASHNVISTQHTSNTHTPIATISSAPSHIQHHNQSVVVSQHHPTALTHHGTPIVSSISCSTQSQLSSTVPSLSSTSTSTMTSSHHIVNSNNVTSVVAAGQHFKTNIVSRATTPIIRPASNVMNNNNDNLHHSVSVSSIGTGTHISHTHAHTQSHSHPYHLSTAATVTTTSVTTSTSFTAATQLGTTQRISSPVITTIASAGSATPSTATCIPVVQQGHFLCEWRGCMRNFKSANEVYMHACESHCPQGSQEIQCLWERCDAMKRKRFSLMTHLYDRHCNADVLRMMAVRRKQLSVTGRSEIPAPSPPTPHPGYAPNAAFHAIKRHALEFVNPKELQDDNEGPVTKSIRLTSALILRNLVIYSTYGRRYLTSYEPHLASVALSNVESSRTIAQVLFDMSQPR
ncbi:brahma associated protein 170kD isoform X2 [Lycorma delicatula]|uniref:brahma associated protein 170kD isoform X2 n=1 Tax=Lycorma delicatula TaxID=130591 RepID=UPI003F511C21